MKIPFSRHQKQKLFSPESDKSDYVGLLKSNSITFGNFTISWGWKSEVQILFRNFMQEFLHKTGLLKFGRKALDVGGGWEGRDGVKINALLSDSTENIIE